MSKPSLLPGEREIATYRANRTQGWRAVGGHLLLSDRRVLFYPHKFDSSTGGRPWECALAEIVAVGLAGRGSNPFNGSMRRRLRIDRPASVDYFVVNKGEVIVDAIRQALAG